MAVPPIDAAPLTEVPAPPASGRRAELLADIRTRVELWSYISIGVVLIILSVVSLPFRRPGIRPAGRRR